MKRNLENLANQMFDVLVIGGGIHGALVAWDAALRGLSVALIERGDFGSATSQNSLKIIHGGLRYLQDGNLARTRTMARERTTWMRIAPHLVHPLSCLMPTMKKISRSRLVLGGAMLINDLLSFDRNNLRDLEKHLPNGKIISQRKLADILPGYDVNSFTGGAAWHDAQVYNTERLLLDFILSAANVGADVANYVEAVDFIRQGNRVVGVQAKDVHSEKVFDIKAHTVINCTGAWTDELLEKVLCRSGYSNSIAMNIIVDKVWPNIAAGLPSQPSDGRSSQILFFVPWRDVTMIGTWHIPWHEAAGAFKISKSMVQDFLDEINSAFPQLKLTIENIQHITWGFLPVNKEDMYQKPVRLTRDSVLIDLEKNNLSGLISVLGVKFTTARVTAEKVVDLVAEKLIRNVGKCQTHIKPVYGGRIDDFNVFMKKAKAEAPDFLDTTIIEHLVYTYGSEYQNLMQYVINTPKFGERIDPNLPVTAAEVVHAVRHEMALTLADVVQRRTELGATGLPSITVLQRCAEWLGNELGWGPERHSIEINSVIQAYPFKKSEGVTV